MRKPLTIVFCLTIILSSCDGTNPPEEMKITTDSVPTVVEKKDTVKENLDEYTRFKFDFAVANIPSPAEVITDMASYNLTYNNAYLHSVDKVKGYGTDFSRSINLGIYNLDMAYAMANNRGTDVIKYLKASLTEIEALGMKSAFDQLVAKRTETNINNKDSLLKIVDEMYVVADKYLRTNQRIQTATHIFVGSWIEALSIMCRTDAEEKDPVQKARIHKQLWDQRFYLKNIIELEQQFKSDKEDAELIRYLNDIYISIDLVKEPKELTGEKFKEIARKVFGLREKLVG